MVGCREKLPQRSFDYVLQCPCPAPLVRHVCFDFSSDELCTTPRVFVYLLNLCKFFIWQSHNNLCFCHVLSGTVDIIPKVKVRLKCHLPIFFKRFQSSRRCRYFRHQWSALGVVASVSGNCLTIAFSCFACFVFCSCATPWLARGYYYRFVFCFTCDPLAG